MEGVHLDGRHVLEVSRNPLEVAEQEQEDDETLLEGLLPAPAPAPAPPEPASPQESHRALLLIRLTRMDGGAQKGAPRDPPG